MAWNEPGGEKRNPWNKPQQSQNDLDDVLRNFQRRLSALFGRGGGGGGLGGGQSSPGLGKGFSSIVVLIAAVWVGSGLYRVDAQERAVILRFGKYVQTTGPGYNWHLPWPIEQKRIVNVSQQSSITDDARMLTADTNLVEVKSAVQYTKPDPASPLQGQRCGRDAGAGERERHARGGRQASIDKALAFDPSITERAKKLLQKTLDNYDLGVNIVSVQLNDVVVPEPVQDAQRDAIKADKDRQRYQQDAETYRNDWCRARGVRPRRKCSTPRPIGSRWWPWRRARPRGSIRF